jgi:energy-coupling factor transporter ATP-binding protein EcfA2
MTTFKSISLRNWRQFASVSIDFHPRLTVITGSNGAGKSTILNICSQHFGYSRPFLATPKRRKGGGIAYDLGYYRPYGHPGPTDEAFEEDIEEDSERDEEEQLDFLVPAIFDEAGQQPSANTISMNHATGAFVEIGSISYQNGMVAQIGFQENQTQAYGLQITNQQQVLGVPISSHRTVSVYQQVQGLSFQLITIASAYQSFFGEYVNRMNGGHTQFSPLYRMKETLIAMAAFGEGNQHLEKNAELFSAFEGFGKVLKKVLPRELGFQKLLVRIPDIVLKTRSGEFILDASSGGVTAVIEIAWQLYLYSLTNSEFVVTLDEPENHLHPSMQRSILSNLIDAFPGAQFIVATHSPFIVSAVEDSQVYALKYMGRVGQSGLPTRGNRKVRAIALDQKGKAGNASEILKEVLGVSVSMPEWAAKRLDGIVLEFQNVEISTENLNSLRRRLADSGFSEYYPDALARLVADK